MNWSPSISLPVGSGVDILRPLLLRPNQLDFDSRFHSFHSCSVERASTAQPVIPFSYFLCWFLSKAPLRSELGIRHCI